jgi:hypothetical protein
LILFALGAAFVFVIVAGSGSSTATGRVGGDFPAFYSAGSIVADGDIDRLYDLDVQAAAQTELLGDEDGFIMYPYAPHVAAAYAPLSELPYRSAYLVHTVLMVSALIGALWLIRPMVPLVDRWFGAVVAGAMTAYPVFVGVLGGQNTAASLLLLAATWRAWHEDRDGWAGLALALLLFRPQYAIPLIGLALLDRRWRTVATASVGGAMVWVANAALVGPAWITVWYDGVRPLLEADAEINAANEIAPIGVLVAAFGESTLAIGVGGLVSVAAGVGLMVLWWRRPVDLTSRMAITTAALTLLGPHAIYYDSALLVFAVLVLLDRNRLSPVATAAIWAAGLVHLTKSIADVSPLIVVVLTVAGIAAQRLSTPDQPAGDPERVLPIQDSYSVR